MWLSETLNALPTKGVGGAVTATPAQLEDFHIAVNRCVQQCSALLNSIHLFHPLRCLHKINVVPPWAGVFHRIILKFILLVFQFKIEWKGLKWAFIIFFTAPLNWNPSREQCANSRDSTDDVTSPMTFNCCPNLKADELRIRHLLVNCRSSTNKNRHNFARIFLSL